MMNDCVAWIRIEMALASVMAQLHATNDWTAILAEYQGDAPITSMGKLDHAFFAERQAAGRA
jgi:hypothetical protein